MTQTMRGVQLVGHGGFDTLVYREDLPRPVAGPGEALIRVAACGLNNTDVNTRTAWYSKGNVEATSGQENSDAQEQDATWGGAAISFPRIQGADVCGTVEAVGQGGDPALIGRRVLIDTWLRDWDDPLNLAKTGYFGSEMDGGFADYTKAPLTNVHPIDSDLSDAALATFATSYITAENMLNRAQVGAGDVVLIPGASGGVGSALIQLANRRGAQTVAMASPSKHAGLAAAKPTALLPRSVPDLAAALQEAIGRPNVTVLADVVGGPDWPAWLEVIERGGRLTCAGAIAGPLVAFDLRSFYLRDLTFTGATVVPPGVFADLVGYIERGEIKPMLAATYPLRALQAAQQAFIEKQHVGNIVVTTDEL